MSFPDYDKYDALGLAALVAKGDVKPEELLDEAIARTEKLNPQLNAVVLKHYDEARAQIKKGLPKGAFRGVPFLLKDLHMFWKGTKTQSGSRAFEGLVADHDSTLAERYRDAGFVIFGKTNTPELGLAGTTEPVFYGPTHNPWNPAHSPGGSSGGAAAAVSAGIVPAAHASDGGGSIRMPAAACGLFGLKPTRGRTPAGPMRGEGWSGMSISHVVSHSVRDSAAILDATTGMAPGDPYCAPPMEGTFLDASQKPPRRLRIAFSTLRPDGTRPEVEVETSIKNAVKLCEGLGHELIEDHPKRDPAVMGRHQTALIASHIAAFMHEHGEARGRPVSRQEVEELTWRFMEIGGEVGAQAYVNALNFIHKLGREMGRFHEKYDVFLSPVFGTPPIPLGVMNMDSDDFDTSSEVFNRVMPYTATANMTGQPAMSVPLHWSKDGLPVGVMFTGRFGDDALLLSLATQMESAQDWKTRRPPLHA